MPNFIYKCTKCGSAKRIQISESYVAPYSMISCPDCNHKNIMCNVLTDDSENEINDPIRNV